ncbi:MAG: hypothetical protein IPM69_06735 [Ignavibacteria bacterium]|nr:hypothetical protein [Ignavibacteria bacterium]
MKLPAFLKCSECKSLLLLSDEERVSKRFKCSECGHTFDHSISELHLSTIASTFSGTDVFTVRHCDNEIQVVYLPNNEIIVLYNGDVIARTPIGSKVFGEKHELMFTVKNISKIELIRLK